MIHTYLIPFHNYKQVYILFKNISNMINKLLTQTGRIFKISLNMRTLEYLHTFEYYTGHKYR